MVQHATDKGDKRFNHEVVNNENKLQYFNHTFMYFFTRLTLKFKLYIFYKQFRETSLRPTCQTIILGAIL